MLTFKLLSLIISHGAECGFVNVADEGQHFHFSSSCPNSTG